MLIQLSPWFFQIGLPPHPANSKTNPATKIVLSKNLQTDRSFFRIDLLSDKKNMAELLYSLWYLYVIMDLSQTYVN